MTSWIVNRLSEPTSYAGAAAAINGVVNIANGDLAPQNWFEAIFGAIAFVMPEATPVANLFSGLIQTAMSNAAQAQTSANSALQAASSANTVAIAAANTASSAHTVATNALTAANQPTGSSPVVTTP